MTTMGLSRTVSEINGDFGQKSQKNPTRIFCTAAEWAQFGILYRRLASKNDGAIGPRKKFDDIFSSVDTIYQRDRRADKTDRQTPGDSNDCT